MALEIRTHREGERARLVPAGRFDLAHAATVVTALQRAQVSVEGCRSVELDLGELVRVDGTGAVLLARLVDQLEANGLHTEIVAPGNQNAARLIALYRGRRPERRAAQALDSALAHWQAHARTAEDGSPRR